MVLVISLFLNWGGGVSAWDGFSGMHILMLLVGLAAIAAAALPASGAGVTLPTQTPMILTALGIAVFGFAFGWELEAAGEIGVWLAILGSLGIAYGAYEWGRSPVMPVASPPVSSQPPPPTTPAI